MIFQAQIPLSGQRKGGNVRGEGSCSDRQTPGAAWSPAASDTAHWELEQVELELENTNRQSKFPAIWGIKCYLVLPELPWRHL